MKNMMTILFVILGFLSIVFPYIIVHSLLSAQEKILAGEPYDKEETRAAIGLTCMAISPFVIALLVTA